MYTASNHTVSSGTSYSNDLVSQHPATSDLSSGNMAGMGSYSDGQRTVFDHKPFTRLRNKNSDLESEHSHVSLQPFPIFAQTSEIQSVND